MKTVKSPRVTFPQVHPENAVADYKISQKFQKIEKLYPEFDVVRNNDPKSNLTLLQINLRDTEELLHQKRKHQTNVRQQLDKQWDELETKEEALRENFINFNTFVHENMEKRERAEKKIIEELGILEQRQRDINNCVHSYTDLNQAKHDMDMKIKEYHLYEDYLDKVVEYSGEFSSIQDMINRYLALVYAKKHLAKLQEDNLRDLENARSDMMKLVEEKNLIIMGLNNQIASLQARYENANIKSLECENLVVRIKNNAVSAMNEMDEVESSVWNVYEHMAQSKDHPVLIKKDDVEAQMVYIKRTLTELSKVNQILKKRAKQLSKMKVKE